MVYLAITTIWPYAKLYISVFETDGLVHCWFFWRASSDLMWCDITHSNYNDIIIAYLVISQSVRMTHAHTHTHFVAALVGPERGFLWLTLSSCRATNGSFIQVTDFIFKPQNTRTSACVCLCSYICFHNLWICHHTIRRNIDVNNQALISLIKFTNFTIH